MIYKQTIIKDNSEGVDKHFIDYLNIYKETLNTTIDDQPLWNQYIKNIVVISKYTKDSPELENIRLIETHKNINIQKFDAIYPTEKPPAFATPGYYGCALSHYNVIKMAKENNWENVMILEDDVILHKNFNKYMNYIVDEIKNEEWHLLYGFKDYPRPTTVKIIKTFKYVNQIKEIGSTHCYCINKSAYDATLIHYDILFNLKKEPNRSLHFSNIDIFYKRNTQFNKYAPILNLASYINRIGCMTYSIKDGKNAFYSNQIIDTKIDFPNLEATIINVCNLSCEYCSTAAPYHKNNTYSIQNFENDIKHLSKFCHYKEFRILGGEPFLLENLEEYIDILKYYNICDTIRVLTNGTLLYNYKNQNIFNKIDILYISYYKNINTTLIDKWLDSNNVPKTCTIKKIVYENFSKLLSLQKQDDIITKNTYDNCPFKKCTTVYNGKLYLCQESIANNKLLNHQNINIENFQNDSFDIYSVNSNIEYLEKFNILKNKPLNSCKYCLGNGPKSAHKQIKVEKIL